MSKRCYILCADGYAEEVVQEASVFLSAKEMTPQILGLKRGWIYGDAGGRVSPEALISQLLGARGERPLPDVLLLAGGTTCGQYLLTDPRVHLLVRRMLAFSCPVGWLRPVSYPLLALLDKQANESSFLWQETETTEDFVNGFVQRCNDAGERRLASWTKREQIS